MKTTTNAYTKHAPVICAIVGALLVLAGLSGCDAAAQAAAIGSTSFREIAPNPVPSASPTSTPAAPTYSVLNDFGWKGEVMPLNFARVWISQPPAPYFDTLTIGQRTRVQWDQYEPGHFLVDGRQNRRCVAYITINGTPDSGTVTLDSSKIVWAFDPQETVGSPPCPGVPSGTFAYSVDASGLTLDGVTYAEVQ